jgi:hypothetical protein
MKTICVLSSRDLVIFARIFAAEQGDRDELREMSGTHPRFARRLD